MHLRSISSVLSSDLAIDLGTANTLVYAAGKGIVVDEPSVVTVHSDTGAVEAVGSTAEDMIGRTPAGLTAVRPMREGVIADFKLTEKMLQHFMQQAHKRKTLVRPRVVIGVPTETTAVEKRAVMDAAFRANASEVHLVEQAFVGALGAGMPITEPTGNMIVDIGGGTTDVAVISLSGIVYARSLRVAGNHMDDAIVDHIKRKYNVLIGERTAESVKKQIGSAFPLDRPVTMDVKGRDLIKGIPRTVSVGDAEIRESLSPCISAIVNAIFAALERTPPELGGDIMERGIVLTGGGALLQNLDARIRQDTGLPVAIAENPLTSVVMGTGKILGDLKLLRKVTVN